MKIFLILIACIGVLVWAHQLKKSEEVPLRNYHQIYEKGYTADRPGPEV